MMKYTNWRYVAQQNGNNTRELRRTIQDIWDEVLAEAFPPKENEEEINVQQLLRMSLSSQPTPDRGADLGDRLITRVHRQQQLAAARQHAQQKEMRWMQPSWQCQLRLPVR